MNKWFACREKTEDPLQSKEMPFIWTCQEVNPPSSMGDGKKKLDNF